MTRWAIAGVLGGVALAVLGAGCGGPALSRDEQVRLLLAKNRALEEKLLASEERVAGLAAGGAQPQKIAAIEDPFRPVAIRFGRYTGVLGAGGLRSESRLKVILEPVDAEGDLVKRAGSLELETFEPAQGGQSPKPFCRWEFSREDLAQTWLNALGVSGYVLKLPWPEGRVPAGPTLLVRARFTTLSGDVLAAETQVEIPQPKTSARQGSP